MSTAKFLVRASPTADGVQQLQKIKATGLRTTPMMTAEEMDEALEKSGGLPVIRP